MHFHLPNIVFIIDSFSNAHAKKNKRGKKYDYTYLDFEGNEVLSIKNDIVKYDMNIPLDNIDIKEKQYIDHVSRCYFIMCKLKEKYSSNITPRMVDNFVMCVNVNKNKQEAEVE